MHPGESGFFHLIVNHSKDNCSPVHVGRDDRQAEDYMSHRDVCYFGTVMGTKFLELLRVGAGLSRHSGQAAHQVLHG